MSIDNLIEEMHGTLSTLNLCLNNTDGIVHHDIEIAINYLKCMLLKKDYELLFNDDIKKISTKEVHSILISVSDDIQRYTDYFKDDYLIGTWWNVNLAISDLELDNTITNECTSKKLIRK